MTNGDLFYAFIVGGGSAGAVMANRLSETPCVSVLLLEAGGHPPLLTEVPSLGRLFYNTEIDWNYITVPQKYAAFAHIDNVSIPNYNTHTMFLSFKVNY